VAELPAEAYFGDVPWWKLDTWPGKNMKFGGFPKLAAYLYFNVDVGGQFTMRELRTALGSSAPDNAEHLNRRLRELRKHDWDFTSYKDRAGQEVDTYVLRQKGKRIWLGEKNPGTTISAALRRQVIERDLNRCVICGVGAGEPYPGELGTAARLTAGHRRAGNRLGAPTLDNLQAECSRCNEPVGDTPPNPETFEEVKAQVSRLGAAEKATLLDWLEGGYRQRNRVDLAYDRIRRLAPSERDEFIDYLREATEGR